MARYYETRRVFLMTKRSLLIFGFRDRQEHLELTREHTEQKLQLSADEDDLRDHLHGCQMRNPTVAVEPAHAELEDLCE
jgi:hypothetical protein